MSDYALETRVAAGSLVWRVGDDLDDITPAELAALPPFDGFLSDVGLADLPAGSVIDAAQDAAGTWPARPTARTDMRVNWLGYPGLTSTPAEALEGDTYMMRPA